MTKEGRTTMRCLFARRAISRAEDRGTKLPRWVERHAGRCGSCGEYARFTASLKARLAGERTAFLAAGPDFPLNESAWAASGDPGVQERALGRRLVLRPLPAAAGALAVLAAGLVLLLVALREPSPSPRDRAAALAALKSFTAVPDRLPGAVTEAESSLDKERQILEKSVASALEYLQARLNIKIERREPRGKST
jgi:hypothetical protein